MLRLLVFVLITLLLAGCTKKPNPPTKIAINPWPGYEFLLLAEHLGFYEEQGLNVVFVPFSSLSDSQRAYISGRVDGFASTLIEVVQAHILSHRSFKVVLIPDYSNGSDVIVAASPINSVEDLKGLRVGAEVSSLGIYFLHRALSTAGLTLDDVVLKNFEQSAAKDAFKNNQIDAFVTYPPYSLRLLQSGNRQAIFDSSHIPLDIVDTLSIATDILEKDPSFVAKLHKAWQKAIEYGKSQPDKAMEKMARRQGISKAYFAQTLQGIELVNYQQQVELFNNPQNLQNKLSDVCQVLLHIEAIEYNCKDLPNLIYLGKI